MARQSVRGIRFARSLACSRTSGYSRCGYSPRILAASILVFCAVLRAPSELRDYVTGIGSDALSRKAPSNPRIAKYSTITELALRLTCCISIVRDQSPPIRSNVSYRVEYNRHLRFFLKIFSRIYKETEHCNNIYYLILFWKG